MCIRDRAQGHHLEGVETQRHLSLSARQQMQGRIVRHYGVDCVADELPGALGDPLLHGAVGPLQRLVRGRQLELADPGDVGARPPPPVPGGRPPRPGPRRNESCARGRLPRPTGIAAGGIRGEANAAGMLRRSRGPGNLSARGRTRHRRGAPMLRRNEAEAANGSTSGQSHRSPSRFICVRRRTASVPRTGAETGERVVAPRLVEIAHARVDQPRAGRPRSVCRQATAPPEVRAQSLSLRFGFASAHQLLLRSFRWRGWYRLQVDDRPRFFAVG